MTATLFTLGYEKRSLQEYVDLLRRARVDVVVDVRETAWSHKPGFSKSALAAELAAVGVEYIHAHFAGNPKWLRSEATNQVECLAWYAEYLDAHSEVLDAFEHLVSDLVGAGKRVCLTCFERHPDDCHRGVLAERWRDRGRRRVEHIAPDGCARLVPT